MRSVNVGTVTCDQTGHRTEAKCEEYGDKSTRFSPPTNQTNADQDYRCYWPCLGTQPSGNTHVTRRGQGSELPRVLTEKPARDFVDHGRPLEKMRLLFSIGKRAREDRAHTRSKCITLDQAHALKHSRTHAYTHLEMNKSMPLALLVRVRSDPLAMPIARSRYQQWQRCVMGSCHWLGGAANSRPCSKTFMSRRRQ